MSQTKDIPENLKGTSQLGVDQKLCDLRDLRVNRFQIANRKSSIENSVDALQAAIERMPQAELPLTHRFTPGMYIRTIFMPAGALVISKIHRTQHPFVVTKGRCLVWDSQNPVASGAATIKAGHIGITMPGTRRILYIYEDTEWTTFHATDKTTPEAVEADIIEPHDFDRDEALRLFEDLGKFGRRVSATRANRPTPDVSRL